MQKNLPPATLDRLSPPPRPGQYTFFENVASHPFDAASDALDLVTAWWLMDAAFLAYSSEADISSVLREDTFGFAITVRTFSGGRSTQCYVASSGGWIVLVFRGTQVDAFWPSIVDWCSDASGALGLIGTYTFGSPRVGDDGFCRRIPGVVWRFRNNSDLVTHVPLGLVFRHAGALALIDASGRFHADPSPTEEALFDAASTRFSVADAQHLASLFSIAEPDIHVPGPFADHAPINYAIRLWNCYDAQA